MRKNANIQSVEEAIKRLQEGEIFYYKSSTIYYSQKSILKGLSPFRIVDLFDNCSLSHSWTDYKDWEREIKWYEQEFPKLGRICWVWDEEDGDSNPRTRIETILAYNSTNYTPFSGQRYHWQRAELVTPEELKEINNI